MPQVLGALPPVWAIWTALLAPGPQPQAQPDQASGEESGRWKLALLDTPSPCPSTSQIHTPKHECWCCVQPKASPTVQLRLQDKGGQDKACCLLGAGEIHFLLTVVLHGCQPGEQDVKEESHNDKTDEE